MSWQFTPYAFLYWLVAAVAFTSTWLIGHRRGRPELRALAWFLMTLGLFGLAGGLELAVGDLGIKMILLQLQNTATVLMSTFLLLFIVRYYGYDLQRSLLAGLWSAAALVLALVWTNQWFHLIYLPLEWAPGQDLTPGLVLYHHGPLYGLLALFSFAVTLLALAGIVLKAVRGAPARRRQAVWLAVAIILPLIAYLVYLAGGDLLTGLNLIPVAFTMTGLLVAGAVFTDLEQRVAERTAVLEDAIHALEAEVAARQQAEIALTEVKENLVQQVTDQSRKLAALYEVILVADENAAEAEVLDHCLERVLAVMSSQAACFHQLQEDEGALQLVAQRGLEPEDRAALASLPAAWLNSDIPRLLTDLLADPQVAPAVPKELRRTGFGSYLGTPVFLQGEILGALSIFWERPRRPAVEEIALFSALADQIGVIIENARLRQEMEEMAVLRERRRLARNLHDSVTQSLHSLVLLADTSVYLLARQDNQNLPRLLSQVSDSASQALKELRLMLYELQLVSSREIDLAQALQTRLDAVERRAGIAAQLEIAETAIWPEDGQNELYYIAIEALNNALRHGRASRVSVRLAGDSREFNLEVADNGNGFDPGRQHSGGMGLRNMAERAERLGGGVTLDSTPGQGTRIRVTIPLAPRENLLLEDHGYHTSSRR